MIEQILVTKAVEAVNQLFNTQVEPNLLAVQRTIPAYRDQGDFSLVVFPLLKISHKSPEETANMIGNALLDSMPEAVSFGVVKGYLNIRIKTEYWIQILADQYKAETYGIKQPDQSQPVVVEYSSPNTNKPLHLGHIRNNLLGYSVSQLLKATGKNVVKVNLVNDRGIHICKSMLAWKKWGKDETPESTGKKGDKLVGDYYVLFSKKEKQQFRSFKNNWNNKVVPINLKLLENFKLQEIKHLLSLTWNYINERWYNKDYNFYNDYIAGLKKVALEIPHCDFLNEFIEKELITKFLIKRIKRQLHNSLIAQAQRMLIKWERYDPEVRQLWEKMNGWVYQGFDETYERLGVSFDKIYYESQTYLLGKKIVEEGLEKGVLTKKADGSVWIDLTAEGLDEKLLLRSDGTSVYMTQDLGTAQLRSDDFAPQKLIYVVGNEQNYHFDVLKLILQKLDRPWADSIFHLSYGMVELPEGKMKSREGTVVDADDLMDEMIATARAMTEELGKIEDFNSSEAESLYNMVGLGALKYFILKVDPKKNMTFNPRESIDFNGNTGPFIQYTHARIKSVLRKAGEDVAFQNVAELHSKETDLLILLYQFPQVLQQAASDLSPSTLANYLFDVAREYNQFYHELTILKEENPAKRALRLALSQLTSSVIKNGMKLLGIDVPEKM